MAEEIKKNKLPPGIAEEFNLQDENALNEFIDDAAFNVFVESIGEAFTVDMGTNAGSTDLLIEVMNEHLSDPTKKADFTVDLM